MSLVLLLALFLSGAALALWVFSRRGFEAPDHPRGGEVPVLLRRRIHLHVHVIDRLPETRFFPSGQHVTGRFDAQAIEQWLNSSPPSHQAWPVTPASSPPPTATLPT